MTNATGTVDELSTLKSEVAELNESRKLADKVGAEQAESKKCADTAAETDRAEACSEGSSERAIVDQLEEYLSEIEEAARERPALALLATFAAGVIVGHLFSRK